jgi:hypothetical protein
VGPAQSADDWYDRKATPNQRAYKALKIAIIVLAVSMPIVAEWGALAVGVTAGFILLLEGLQHLNKWQENWILYRS